MNSFAYYLANSESKIGFLKRYEKLFSVHEFFSSMALQWVFGATLLSYYATFNAWISSDALTIPELIRGNATCWPYFKNCTDYYFLYNLPFGYSQTTLYMFLLGILMLVVYLMQRKEWLLAHLLLVIPYIWHALGTFVLTHQFGGNYDYYLFVFTSILLFSGHKEYFIKVALVVFYFLSTATKIHESWVLGSYFSALSTGLPFFPDWAIPFATNQLIFMEMVGSWFLLSRRTLVQKVVVTYFIFFHLYSGILVEYRYPTIVLPTLVIVFALFYRYQRTPVDKMSLVGWVVILLCFCAQMVPFLIEGDQKFTLEGNRFGMYMFESNHQCVSTVTLYRNDGTTKDMSKKSVSARNRCDPFDFLQKIQYTCKHSINVSRISWSLDHSINGGPFYRMVDTEDACKIDYKAWSHNSWIILPKEAEIVGYPLKNIFF